MNNATQQFNTVAPASPRRAAMVAELLGLADKDPNMLIAILDARLMETMSRSNDEFRKEIINKLRTIAGSSTAKEFRDTVLTTINEACEVSTVPEKIQSMQERLLHLKGAAQRQRQDYVDLIEPIQAAITRRQQEFEGETIDILLALAEAVPELLRRYDAQAARSGYDNRHLLYFLPKLAKDAQSMAHAYQTNGDCVNLHREAKSCERYICGIYDEAVHSLQAADRKVSLAGDFYCGIKEDMPWKPIHIVRRSP